MRSQVFSDYYKSLFDNTFDGLAFCQMIFDPQGRPVDWIYLEVNKNFEKLTGLKKIVGKKVTEAIPGIASSNPELFEIYGRVSLTGKPESFETYVEPLLRWFLVSVYSPKKNFFIAVFKDTTSQKQTEKELKNARIAAQNVLEDLSIEKSELEIAWAKEEAILLSIGDGLVAVDESGNVTVINESAQNMLGLISKEILGKPWIEVMQIEDERGNQILKEKRPITMAFSQTTTTTGPTYYYVQKDKTKFPVAITVTPVKLGGKIIGAIEVFRDITREKEIDRAKSEFVSLASHQLRTPLGIMKWYLEALEHDAWFKNASVTVKEYFAEVSKNNGRILNLVGELLSVSRIDSGRIKNDPKPTDTLSVVKDIVDQMQLSAKNKNVTLSLVLKQPQIPHISLDPLLFREVMENVVVNALEYTPSSGRVEVIVAANETYLCIAVKDNGIGIPESDQKKLFTKFFRASNAVKRNPEGSGLGLYVVKSYIEGWGGKITFESVEGKGSIFTISLPISQKKDTS